MKTGKGKREEVSTVCDITVKFHRFSNKSRTTTATYPVGMGMFRFIVAGGGDCAETKGNIPKTIPRHKIAVKRPEVREAYPFLHLFLGPTGCVEARIKLIN